MDPFEFPWAPFGIVVVRTKESALFFGGESGHINSKVGNYELFQNEGVICPHAFILEK